MLRRASVGEVRSGEVTLEDGHLVVTMRVYPRFLRRSLVSEYVSSLAPAADLFARYRERKKAHGDQNRAFAEAGYEARFELDEEGTRELARLTATSAERDVFLVCQCDRREHCHVDLLLLLAERRFGAHIGELAGEYAEYRRRLSNGT